MMMIILIMQSMNICMFLFFVVFNFETHSISSNQHKNYMIVFVSDKITTWACQNCHNININKDNAQITEVGAQTFVYKHCEIIL